MAFCKNCGSPVEGKFCGKCGTPVDAPAPSQQAAPPSYGQPQQQYGAAPAPAPAAGGLTENVAGLLCYIPFGVGLIISIVFLLVDPYKQQKFVRFSAFQSIFLHVALFATAIAAAILGGILGFVSSGLSFMIWMLMRLVWLAALVLAVMLMIKANQGQKWVLPVIGPMADKQS